MQFGVGLSKFSGVIPVLELFGELDNVRKMYNIGDVNAVRTEH